METLVFISTVVLAIAAYVYGARKAKKEVERRFVTRDCLDVDQVCDLFFKEGLTNKSLTWELLEHVGREMSINPCLLRPTDRFSVELKPPRGWGFDSARNTLMLDLARLAKERRVDMDSASIQTLSEYIRALTKVY